MRPASLIALFLSLVFCTDITYRRSSRLQKEFVDYRELHSKESYVLQGGFRRALTPEETHDLDAPHHAMNQMSAMMAGWSEGVYTALAFAACALLWLAVVGPVEQKRGGPLLYFGLRGSILGAVVGATLLTAGRAVNEFWGGSFPLGLFKRFDGRLDWEFVWLNGAVAGAIVGAVLGVLRVGVRGLLKRPTATTPRAASGTLGSTDVQKWT